MYDLSTVSITLLPVDRLYDVYFLTVSKLSCRVVVSFYYYYYSRQNGTALTKQVPSPPTVQAHSTSQRHGRAHTRDLSRPLTSIATRQAKPPGHAGDAVLP